MKNLYYPPDPPATIIKIFAIILISWNNSTGQTKDSTFKIELNNFEVYEKSIKEFYVKKWEAERSEFIITNEKPILLYLPSVGITLGMPTISFNTNSIITAKRDKKILEAKLNSIDMKYRIEYQEQLQGLKNEYYKLRLIQNGLELEKRIIDLEDKFFNDFTSNEEHDKVITPKEFRIKVIEHQKSSINYYRKQDEYFLKVLEFQKLAKYQLPIVNPFQTVQR